MEREEALEVLRGGPDGVERWNVARAEGSFVLPPLDGVDLRGAVLERANLARVILNDARLTEATLAEADLGGADLRGAVLRRATLRRVRLAAANLDGANLRAAGLGLANLEGATLRGANLHGADLRGASLAGTDLTRARAGSTVFDADLSGARGLDALRHSSPSLLSQSALRSLAVDPPDGFLRGCGLAHWEVASVKLHDPNLTPEEIAEVQNTMFALRSSQPVQVRPVFISYAREDEEAVDRVQLALHEEGINTWRDIHDATAGPIEEQIHQAMTSRLVLVVFSGRSVGSRWVKDEVLTACELADQQDRHVLVPIALDDSWESAKWPSRFMRDVKEYNVLDFSGWQDDAAFDREFRKLAAGIRRWYT